MELGIEFDMLEFSIKFGTKFCIEFDIEFDKLEIGIECGKLSSFVHNGFPYRLPCICNLKSISVLSGCLSMPDATSLHHCLKKSS